MTIINEASSRAGEVRAGDTQFFNTSNAGSATITNNGASVGGAPGGFTEFRNQSSAGNATIVNNGGTNGGAGGITKFLDSSDGGSAQAITNGSGIFDISGLSVTVPGMGIGSIEGSGTYSLGSKMLSVGGNSLSTTVSGRIQDGGLSGGTGGSVVKVGAGTLTLTGANTYSGGTNLKGGILAVINDVNLGTGPLSFDGGTLQATSSFTLNPNRGITLNAGGGTFDVTRANVLLIYGGVIAGAGNLTKIGTGTLALSGSNTYEGPTAINAGVLRISQDASLGMPPGAPVSNQLTFNGGTLQATSSFTLNPNRGVTLNAGGGTFDVGAANLTYGGVITGPGALTKAGAGTLMLLGTSTYTGGTIVNGERYNSAMVGRSGALLEMSLTTGFWLQSKRCFYLWRSDQRCGERATNWGWNNHSNRQQYLRWRDNDHGRNAPTR